ncbi:MAG: hypothetical protein GIW99_04485 [Candidatus Eremiobacteraeota bacterium]|nr:hypothetical protein [Candidatus Eremiobacteraeota bacterium]MBC5826928.1 hypothetical protein [Candidatus Eremiobacteraeota bacterium]
MSRSWTAAAIATIAAAMIAGPGLAATRVTVPGGTTVTVAVVNPISSADAKVGDVFQIKAAQDVVVGGWVVIPKDSPGQGEVASVEQAGSHGKSGKLGLQLDWIYSADGGKVKLSNVNHSASGQGNKGAASTATIASYLVLGPVGLFAHNFVRGKDVTVDSSQKLPFYVDSTVHVRATQRASSDSGGFDH